MKPGAWRPGHGSLPSSGAHTRYLMEAAVSLGLLDATGTMSPVLPLPLGEGEGRMLHATGTMLPHCLLAGTLRRHPHDSVIPP